MPAQDVLSELLARLQGVGFGGLLVAILYGSYRGWWVWGKDYQLLKQECDEWKSMALKGTGLAKDLLSLHRGSVTEKE